MFEAHHLREINEILSMRSRMWRRWHVTDKPPQNGTRQGDTTGIHPPKHGPKEHRLAGGGREGRRGGCMYACLHVQAHACKEMP